MKRAYSQGKIIKNSIEKKITKEEKEQKNLHSKEKELFNYVKEEEILIKGGTPWSIPDPADCEWCTRLKINREHPSILPETIHVTSKLFL